MIKSKVSWEEAATKWLHEALDKSLAVIDNERFVLKALAASFGALSIDLIDADSITAHCRTRLDAGRKPLTVNRDLRILRAVLRAAHRRGDLDSVPHVRMLKITTKRLRWISYEESRALLQHLPSHQVAPVSFALETGLRKTNVAQLRWDQIDMDRAMFWVYADQAKGRRPIGVPLSPSALNILRGQHGQHARYVFTYLGKPIKNLNTKAYRNALRSAGIENFRWHDLRHTWASWHAQNGTPMNYLQELGSWSDPSSVMIYTHLSVDHLRQHVAANHARVRDRHPKGGRRSVRSRSE